MDNLPLTRDLTAKRRRARVEWHRPSLQAVPPPPRSAARLVQAGSPGGMWGSAMSAEPAPG